MNWNSHKGRSTFISKGILARFFPIWELIPTQDFSAEMCSRESKKKYKKTRPFPKLWEHAVFHCSYLFIKGPSTIVSENCVSSFDINLNIVLVYKHSNLCSELSLNYVHGHSYSNWRNNKTIKMTKVIVTDSNKRRCK